jgi:putative Ca2+/H+ antiporter (TMEM165/GDT1 family)
MIEAFGAAFGLTFIAELGDKTQIAVLALSARYGFTPVFLGASP